MFMIEGYQWVKDTWVSVQSFDITEIDNTSKADNQIFHNGVRVFYYHKTSSTWARAGLNESRNLEWTIITGGKYPRWAPIGTSDPLNRTMGAMDAQIKERLIEAGKHPIPQQEILEDLEYPGELSPGYQKIIQGSIQHNLEKPADLDSSSWQMILMTSLYPESARDRIQQIQSNAELLKKYQEIVIFLMPEKINTYTFKIDENLPTIGQIYDYTAWLIFQELEEKTELTPPKMSNTELGNKTVGELKSSEILVARGFDESQQKILSALVEIFTIPHKPFEGCIKKLSLNEMDQLKSLFNAVRLCQPLTDWQSMIWDDFVIIVTEGDYTLEEFGEKLASFKSLDRNLQITNHYSRIEKNMKYWLSEEFNEIAGFGILAQENYLSNVIYTLNENEKDRLWGKITAENGWENIVDLEDLHTVSRLFHDSSPRTKWIERINRPVILGAIRKMIILTEIDHNYQYYLDWLPDDEARTSVLDAKSTMIRPDESFVFLCIAQLYNQAFFKQCLLMDNFTKALTRDQFLYFINHFLDSNSILKLLKHTGAGRHILTSRLELVEMLRKLDDEDQLKLLDWGSLQKLWHMSTGASLMDLFNQLKESSKNNLLNTYAGNKILSGFLTLEKDRLNMLTLFENKKDKVKNILNYLIHCSDAFYSFADFLSKCSLKNEFFDYMRSGEFAKQVSCLETDAEKNKFFGNFSFFLVLNTPVNSLQFIAGFQILVKSDLSRLRIDEIMKNIEPSFRKKFLFNENVMTKWLSDKGYTADSFKSLIRASFNPGAVFDKNELHLIDKLFEFPEHENFIQAYTSPENFQAYKQELNLKKHRDGGAESGNPKRRKKSMH